MTFEVEAVVTRLEDAGVRLDRALTEADIKRIEKKFAFTFAAEHRALLRTALPSGDAWLNWRHATPAKVRERLQAPIDHVLALARQAWPSSWGTRPADDAVAERAARERLAQAPTLVPLYGQSYLAVTGGPVFEVDASGVRLQASDLLAYIDVQFGDDVPPVPGALPATAVVTFWSALT